MNTTKNNNKGFTIIEVVLVLAIAALIFLMIFVALPALQASQRDTARKNDASLVAAAVTKYIAAYKRTPIQANVADFRRYVPDLDQYSSGNINIYGTRTANPNPDTILVYIRSKCSGPNAVDSGNSRRMAVRIRLEDNTYYCVNAS